MHIDDELLRQAAARTARIAAIDLLAKVREERDRLDATDDAMALHDFRVTLRRLRSWLRAYRPALRDTVTRKHERRLKRIADATGASRDLEVHLEWVANARRRQPASHRAGVEWLRASLEARKIGCDRALREIIEERFEDAVARLERALARYETPVEERDPVFAETTAVLLREHAAGVAKALGKVRGLGDRAAAHSARIAAKRLRYLLAPLSRSIQVDAAVEELIELQDALGELHDAQLFGSEIASAVAGILADRDEAGDADTVPGLTALSRRLRRTEESAFERVHERWLGDGAATLLSHVAGFATLLEERGREGREIERKFLLRALPDPLPPATVVTIDQGYLPGDRLVERIRRSRDGDTVRYTRTVKVGMGVDRAELEEETTEQVFRALWPLTRGCRVQKRRHTIEDGAHHWEIDEFLDRDLVLAEVELARADDVAAIPEWLEGVLERDVTDEKEFSNWSLAH